MSEDKPEFLNDPFAVLRRRWKPALAWASTSLIVGVALTALFVKPLYEATARVFVSSPRISKDFVPIVEAGGPFERLNAMIGKILARPVLAELVEEHRLYLEQRSTKTVADIVGQARDAVTIELDNDFRPVLNAHETARVFQIRFSYREPESAAAVANGLAFRFVKENIRARTEQATVTSEFMKDELERAEAELAEQNRLITLLKEDARGELPDELNASLQRLERLQDQRKSLSLQIVQTEANLIALSQNSTGPGPVKTPEKRLEILQGEIEGAQSRFTAEHPGLLLLRAEEAELRKTVAKGERGSSIGPSLVVGTQRTLEELQTQLSETQAEIVALEKRVERTPKRGEQLAELERKAEVLRENYVEFERKAREADLALRVELAQQGRRVIVLEEAAAPTTPLRSPLLYLLGSFLLALLAGVAAAVAYENADPVLISDDHLKTQVDLPLLASIPKLI